MKKILITAAALVIGLPATAFAATDCCKGVDCCKDGADCCKDGKGDCCADMKKAGENAGHVPSK